MENRQHTREEVLQAFRAAKRRKKEWEEETQIKLAAMQEQIEEAKAAGYYDVDDIAGILPPEKYEGEYLDGYLKDKYNV